MTLVRDIAKELFSMFLADARLSIAILLLVGLVAALVAGLGARPLFDGGVLLLGALAILLEAVVREARRR